MKEDYKVADITLAEFGRREVSLAENEMPALMALEKNIKRSNHYQVQRLWVVFI